MKATGKPLTDKEVTDLHNAKCGLVSFNEQMTHILTKDTLSDVRNMVAVCDRILKPVYKADEKDYRSLKKEVEYLEKDSMAVWSTDHHPTDLVVEVPQYVKDKGSVKVRFVNRHAWVQDGRGTYMSKLYTNPTYADAFEAFNESIEVTGDQHHVFFEGVEYVGVETVDGDVAIYDLVSGS